MATKHDLILAHIESLQVGEKKFLFEELLKV